MDRQLIEKYAQDAKLLREAVQGLTREELLAHPGPGAWSIHELVIHVVDSDGVAIERMKRVIAENNPPLIAFDENFWLGKLHYTEQDLNDALQIFELQRTQFARVLRLLPDAAFGRSGTHSEKGRVSLWEMVQTFESHLLHHLKFLLQKKERLVAARAKSAN